MIKGSLYVVATPIGNLKDITLRALEILQSVDYILCEDTRVSRKLLDHYQIKKNLVSYHQHSDSRKVKEIASWLSEGQNLALITDAGTPGISDPGNRLINELSKILVDLSIISIPGPSALIAALSISGLPTDKFYFAGFPPIKNKRQKYFIELSKNKETCVFYESGHRILKTLIDLQKYFNEDRQVLVGRELTKQFETIYRGSLSKVIKDIFSDSQKGEFVIVISK